MIHPDKIEWQRLIDNHSEMRKIDGIGNSV